MLDTGAWPSEQVTALRQRARHLETRARAADVSGLAHHLQSCEQCFWNGEVDKAKLANCLRNVSEVAWQWRQDLRTRSELFSVDGQGHVSHDRLIIEPPTLLTPPSVEMFESTPPPPDPSNDWLEQSLDVWRRPPLWRRLFSKLKKDAAPRSSTLRPKRLMAPAVFPSLADAVYPERDARSVEASLETESQGPLSEDLPPAPSGTSSRTGWGPPLAVVAVAGLGLVIWTLGGPHEPTVVSSASVPAAASAAQPSAAGSGLAGSGQVRRDVLDAKLAQAHGYGGLESPELADLLDEEAAALAAAGPCAPGTLGCELVSTAHGLSAARPAPAPAPATAGRGAWLEGLELPGIGVRDDERERQLFEFHTRNAVGRETFQELLFRCAAQRELVLGTLARYGLPADALAVPMAASGCVSDIESPEGGRGLWRLTPPAAKAYHLRVKAQVVDERIDPAKATEAAVRLLEDLHRKTGSWELALAAYRLGPLALLSRAAEAGEGAAFWELVEAERLPDEVGKFVSKVQAYALILANLGKFRFQPAPLRPPEMTSPLQVPPGTRLGLVARAAASSTTKIRELNPDVIGDRVPDWPGEKFVLRVPKDSEPRARELLPELIASSDHSDECVPHAFDWGRQRFTTAMASRCEQASGGR